MTDQFRRPQGEGAGELDKFLAGAWIDPAVAALRHDYRALLIAVDGLTPATTAGAEHGVDREVEALLQRAEASAATALSAGLVEDVPHVAAWREAYRAFGAKPQRTRNSLEALLRRCATGLPRVNPLTDTYNAISVRHQIPLGGEDLAGYRGAPHLIRATGDEAFETTSAGEGAVENPGAGEVVWRDDAGVTCRRWNWRQGSRTQLTESTTRALFILDALEPVTDDALVAAGDELVAHLRRLSPDVEVATRLLNARDPHGALEAEAPSSGPSSNETEERP